MDGGFSYGDIIVIGAIAAFILLRYRAMLGEKAEGDDTPRSKAAPLAQYERVIQLPATRQTPIADAKEEIAAHGSLADSFIKMRGLDREFSPEDFLVGARSAHEMLLDAYNKADRTTLKMLLSDALYHQFDRAIAAEEAEGRRNETTLLAITKSTISQATLTGQVATITVDFTSEQVHLVRNNAGDIVEGNPSDAVKVEERWVFTRTLTNTDPNWKIIET